MWLSIRVDERVRDGFYTAVGFGVLGVQRLAVQRRDAQRQLRSLAERIDERVDPVLDGVEKRLPSAPAEALRNTRGLVRTARGILLGDG